MPSPTEPSNPFRSPGEAGSPPPASVRPVFQWQITLVVIMNYSLSAISGVVAVVLLGMAFASRNADMVYFEPGPSFAGPDEMRLYLVGSALISMAFVALGLAAVVAAIGLQRRRIWGRHLAIAIAVLLGAAFLMTLRYVGLLSLPLGIYGVVVLAILSQQKIRLHFQHGRPLMS